MAFTTMESVRKGRGLKPEMEQAMIEQHVPQWFMDSCKKIKYMFPKGHARGVCDDGAARGVV